MAGEAQDVQGIAIGLGLETAGWTSGIAKAKADLQGLIEAASGLSIGVAGRGGRAAAPVTPHVSPTFSVTQHAVRDLRADINQTLRAQAQQGQAIGIPIKLGRVAWGALRAEIAANIGTIPIKVSVSGGAGGGTKLLTAIEATRSGGTMGSAHAAIQGAAASKGISPIPKASGGMVYALARGGHATPQGGLVGRLLGGKGWSEAAEQAASKQYESRARAIQDLTFGVTREAVLARAQMIRSRSSQALSKSPETALDIAYHALSKEREFVGHNRTFLRSRPNISSLLGSLPTARREEGYPTRAARQRSALRSQPFHGSEEFTQLGATQGPRLFAPLSEYSPIDHENYEKWVHRGGYNDLGYGFSRNSSGGRVRRSEGGAVEGPLARRIREAREAQQGIVSTPLPGSQPAEPFVPAWRRYVREKGIGKDLTQRLRGGRVAPLGPGETMPPALGTAPLREGYARGYHSTRGDTEGQAQGRLASIRAHGLKLSKAQGSGYGEPDRVWFSNRAEDYGEKYAVEAHLPRRWFGRWSPRPGDPYTEGGPESNMAVARDVSRRRIASWNAPWMHHYRYMQERVGEGQAPAQVMRQLGSTVVSMRGDKGYGDITKGYDQFVADAWRARHRMAGGPTFKVGDPEGLHMRPSAFLTRMARKFDAQVLARNETLGKEALTPLLRNEPMSMYGWMSLSARKGHQIELTGRGEEADKAVHALGMLIRNPRLTDLARRYSRRSSQGLFSEIGVGPGKPTIIERAAAGRRAGGGDVGGQPYIVNELGSEMFVPNRMAGIIPPHVFDQLPKRDAGGPVMIPGGQQLWTPPEDGWIIPAHLAGQVPHRAKGTPKGPLGMSPDEFQALTPEQRERLFTKGEADEEPARPQVAYQPVVPDVQATLLPGGEIERNVELAPAKNIPAIQRFVRGLPEAPGKLRRILRGEQLATTAAATPRPIESDRIQSAIMGTEPPDATRRVHRQPRGAPGGAGGQFMAAPPLPAGEEERYWTARREAVEFNAAPPRPRIPTGPSAYLREMREVRGAPRVNEELRARQQQVQIESLARRGMTPRSLVSGISEYFGGGGRGRATALKEMQNLKLDLEAMVPRDIRGTTSAMEHWSQRVHETGVNLENEQKIVQGLTDAHKKGTKEFKDHTKLVKEWGQAHEEARIGLADATSLTKQYEDAATRASGGIGRNFLAATAGIAAFQLGMQGISMAFEVGTKAAAPLIDKVLGFGSTSTRVSSEIAKSAAETGNVQAAIAKAGAAGGLGAAGMAYVGQGLTGAVTAKAAGLASGQGMDLRRAAYGAGSAPSGLYGGYGGLFGTPLLASEIFGGGKGFTENVAGEAAGFRNRIQRPGYATLGTSGQRREIPLTTQQIDRNKSALAGLEAETSDYNEALIRGSRYLGEQTSSLQLLTKEQLKATKGLSDADFADLAKKFRSIGDAAGDGANAATMAASGLVLLDKATGAVVSSAQGYKDFWEQAAQGTILPTAETYARQQAIQLKGAQQVADVQRQMVQRVQIPGQLGMQLAAQPFMPAGAGIARMSQLSAGARGILGGAPGGAGIADTQRLQDQLKAEGAAGIEEYRRFIERNITSYGGIGTEQTRTGAGKSWAPGGKWSASISSPGASAGEIAGSEFARLVGSVSDSLDKGQATIYGYGNAINDLNTQIANRQTTLSVHQYNEQVRVLNRNIRYARGLVSGQGATTGAGANLGAMERAQFTLSRAAESLSMALSQRQINFQRSIAGFQAPGITGQERAARQEEAEVAADYAQQQLNIQKQQFVLAGTVFNVQAQNQLTDLERQRSLSAETFSVEQATLKDQKRIAVLQVAQQRLQGKANAIIDQAQTGFGGTLTAAAGYVSAFGDSIKTATDAIRGAIGLQPLYSKPTETQDNSVTRRRTGGTGETPGATGLLGMTAGPTNLLVGEAQGEAVAILRNPRPMMSAAPVGMGGGVTLNMPITITGNTISNATDLHALARAVGEEVERRLGQKAQMLNAPSAFG